MAGKGTKHELGGNTTAFIPPPAGVQPPLIRPPYGSRTKTEVFLADQAQDIHVLQLRDDRITCNGRNVLAFDDGIEWNIQRVQGGPAGALAAGLFNMSLAGSGFVALVTNGPPVLLDVGTAPTFSDAQAAVAWSAGVTTSLKADVNVKTLIGRGSGETFQVGFSGQGWVLVQPSEGGPSGATSA